MAEAGQRDRLTRGAPLVVFVGVILDELTVKEPSPGDGEAKRDEPRPERWDGLPEEKCIQ